MNTTRPELSVVMPCLNEAATVQACIRKAQGYFASAGIAGEVIIADNGSTDGSQGLAFNAGARVVRVAQRGYGSALAGGFAAAEGRYVVMGDADDSYDFERLDAFVDKLRAGAQLVIGNRFRGGIEHGAMPALHRYLGNPVLSFVGRLFFRVRIGDFHCGLRGFERESMLRLGLCTTGMEFASEMVVKASLAGLRIAEVPTKLRPDGRNRPPHLRSWRDGWRHLRFLFLHSPRWLFFYPGLFAFLAGMFGLVALYEGPRHLGGVVLDIHTMLYAAAGTIIGLQMLALGLFTKIAGIRFGVLADDGRVAKFMHTVTLERGLLFGLALVVAGIGWSFRSVVLWQQAGFGPLNPEIVMRNAIPAVTLSLAGFQVLLSAIFIGVLDMAPKRSS